LFKKQVLFLFAIVVSCYMTFFLKLPFLFVILFSVLCYGIGLFAGAGIYLLVLPKKVRLRYSRQQIRFHFTIAVFMILFICGRWVINNCYMHEAYYVLRMSAKMLLLIITFFLGRTFLIKGWSKTISAWVVIYCLFIFFPAIRSSVKFESGQLNPQDNVKALGTLGYASWAPVKESDKSGVTVYDEQGCYKGINMYPSKISSSLYLMNMKGDVLHAWTLKTGGSRTKFEYAELLADGDILAIIDNGEDFIRLGWDSKVKWKAGIDAHHDFYVKENGDIYVLERKDTVVLFGGLPFPTREDSIVILASNGEIKKSIPLYPIYRQHLPLKKVLRIYQQVIDPDNLVKMVSNKLSGRSPFKDVRDIYFSHTNTVEIINKEIKGVCRKGDILVSSRDMSLIGILDVEKCKFVWTWGPGIISGQHQPTLLENGNIMLLDNGWKTRNYSRVIEVDPVTKEIEWEYKAEPKEKFFTYGMGGNQRLPNGNTLITESCRGRVFEITKDGEIVWEFYNPNIREKTQERATIYRMVRITDMESYPILQQFNN